MNRRLAWVLTLAAGNMVATGAAAATADEPGVMGPSATLPAEAAITAATATNFGTALAVDEPASDGGSDEWEVAFTPYLWLAGIKGDIAIPRNDSEAEVDKSFGDILGDLKFAFMGTLDVEYRRFVVHTDVVYLNLGVDVERSTARSSPKAKRT